MTNWRSDKNQNVNISLETIKMIESAFYILQWWKQRTSNQLNYKGVCINHTTSNIPYWIELDLQLDKRIKQNKMKIILKQSNTVVQKKNKSD